MNMPLSKQHYQKIANALCQSYLDLPLKSESCRVVLDDLTNELIRYFKADNPRFDKAKFVKAAQCELRK
jgi:hypothetical protein